MAKVEDLAGRNEQLTVDRTKWEQEAEALKLLNSEIQDKLRAHETELKNLKGLSHYFKPLNLRLPNKPPAYLIGASSPSSQTVAGGESQTSFDSALSLAGRHVAEETHAPKSITSLAAESPSGSTGYANILF